jgi:hypothetical protein
LPPSRRASESPIAIACLRLLTRLPERPERSSPRFISCIARSTFSFALPPYFREPLDPEVELCDVRFAGVFERADELFALRFVVVFERDGARPFVLLDVLRRVAIRQRGATFVPAACVARAYIPASDREPACACIEVVTDLTMARTAVINPAASRPIVRVRTGRETMPMPKIKRDHQALVSCAA